MVEYIKSKSDVAGSLYGSILVIEDDDYLREYLQELLELSGYDVLAASDGNKGLSLFRQFAPDTVLTDLIMPGKDGIRLIMEMKKINPDVRVIAMSGRWNNESGVNCIEAVEFLGADSTLRKPFSAKDLKAALMSALPKRAEIDCM